VAQRILTVLVEDVIEKEKPVVKKSTPPVENPVTTKEKHVAMP
jgi:hypothetical protein